jgi:two-component system sensor histidine kinase AlgZ
MAVNDLPADLPIPALLLQPLAENAIYHGIQQLPGGGTVSVRGRREADAVVLEIRNPQPPPAVRAAPRNGMALDNTRARIEYHFGSRGTLAIDNGTDEFVCKIILPNENPDR